jgi:glycosyltransferase involved in cell wall biosynthesis
LRAHKPDVFVQFDFHLGIPRFRKTKTIAIAYDLIPLLMRNEYLPSVRFAWNHSAGKKAKLRAITRSVYYRVKYRIHYRVFKRANALVAISEATRQSFIDLLKIKPEKITSIPLAPVLPQTKPEMRLAETISKPYIMYVGGTDSRKRLVDIVRAFNIARGRGLDIALVLAGNEFRSVKKIPDIEGRNAIINSPYRDDIKLLGFINDAEKLGLYKNAHVFVFCTVFEGFGLPIIEAMSAGCPVISYNNSSIPEAAGSAALLVETGNYVAVAEKIVALDNKDLRKKMVHLGHKQAKKFNWGKYTRAFLETISTHIP